MGLDMFAFATTEILQAEVDFSIKNAEVIFVWRKHPDLHGWMEELYYSKSGSSDSFNCVNVALTLEDLDRLETDVLNRDLPETSGFFFGQSYAEDQADDLKFIGKARAAISEEKTVYYSSWW